MYRRLLHNSAKHVDRKAVNKLLIVLQRGLAFVRTAVQTDYSNPGFERPRNFYRHGFTSDQRHSTWLTWTPSSVTNSAECGTTFLLSYTSGAYPRHPSCHSLSIFPEKISTSSSVRLSSSGFGPRSARITRSAFR